MTGNLPQTYNFFWTAHFLIIPVNMQIESTNLEAPLGLNAVVIHRFCGLNKYSSLLASLAPLFLDTKSDLNMHQA